MITHRGEDLNGFQRVDVYLDEVPDEGGKRTLINSNWVKPSEEERAESQLVKGQFKEFRTSILLWNFKSWLTGTHHHCSLSYLKGYLDEFFFKLNFRSERETIWSRLIERSLTENRFVRRVRPGVLNI
ncbi:MAG: hypothetical protein EOP49_26770 [Sphingobacteriales bacterium]|nr:MAG: hypothetical protein EOP49_26770 [Sphingobacteriales bacterium]